MYAVSGIKMKLVQLFKDEQSNKRKQPLKWIMKYVCSIHLSQLTQSELRIPK